MNERAEYVPGGMLLHPVAVVALVTWLVNDHVLKSLTPGWLTGKLSDVACLIVCPLLVVAAVELRWPAVPWNRQRWILLAALLVFGLIMGGIRVWPWAADAYRHGLGAAQWPVRALVASLLGSPVPQLRPVQLAMDVTDIATLPSLIVPGLLVRHLRGDRVR
ncbi:MAG TPA: hypothetical protein VJV78_37715 [Polyangiales bacterium]|nr:hypothetical protein [Polyangiales bacterium]